VREERSANSSKGVSRFLYRKRWGLQSFCPLDWHNMSSARVRATHRHTLVHLGASQRASHSSASRDSLNTSLSQMVGLTRAALCRLPLPLHSTIIITLPRISHTHPRTHSRTNRNFVYNFKHHTPRTTLTLRRRRLSWLLDKTGRFVCPKTPP
jgi:hypothetical protein